MSLTGNKGEWSEIYALFKILGETIICVGDENLNKIETLFYPIIKILRQESNQVLEYQVDGDLVFISEGGEEHLSIPIEKFKEQAKLLLNEIKSATGSSFSIPEIESFMNIIGCKKIKADSYNKADIRIVVHDPNTSTNPLLGFSIKSHLGGNSTLLNAGLTTNFIYKIDGVLFDDNEVEDINLISTRAKIKDRIQAIYKKGGCFLFDSTQNPVFNNNLTLIDSLLPAIIASALLKFFTTSSSSIRDIVEMMEEENPLSYDNRNDHKFYEYKIKRLLTDTALGMRPGYVWNGHYDANGGFLIVKETGDIVCYHIYNKNEFENYLFNSTKFETASSSRHQFGIIEKNNNEYFFKLNLQIRFK